MCEKNTRPLLISNNKSDGNLNEQLNVPQKPTAWGKNMDLKTSLEEIAQP